MTPPALSDAERDRHVLDRDGEAVARIAFPLFALLNLAEASSHAAEWPGRFTVLPALSALALATFSWIAWRRRAWLRPIWAWLVVGWCLTILNVVSHLTTRPEATLVFMTMGVLTAGALILPTRAILVVLPISWLAQTASAFMAYRDHAEAAFLTSLFALPMAIAIHLARRTSILGAERQRALEASLAEQRVALERLERERETVRLEAELQARSRALLEQKRLAEVGRLAAGIAHQVNNTVGAILTSADHALLTRDAQTSPLDVAALETIRDQAIRCGQVVRSVMRLSRDEATERWSCNPTQPLRAALRATAEFARSQDAEIELICDPALEAQTARMNPIELEQVFVNLIRNAIEADEAPAHIRIHARLDLDDAEILIEDSGPGVPPSLCERIFEPFFTTRVDAGGTGLGLSLAREIVASHGGQLELDRHGSESDEEPATKPPGGACFRVRLPLEPVARATA